MNRWLMWLVVAILCAELYVAIEFNPFRVVGEVYMQYDRETRQ